VWANGSQVARLTVPLNPSFLVYDGSKTTWGDGSVTSPVLLPNLQQVAGSAINYYVGLQSNGQLAAFANTTINPNNALVTATGSNTPRTLANRFTDVVNVKDFGAVCDGITNDYDAWVAAFASMPEGGIVNFNGWSYIGSNLNVPNGCIIAGNFLASGQIRSPYDQTTVSSCLVLPSAASVVLNNNCGVINTVILNSQNSPTGTYPLPFANSTIAQSAVNAFAGTAITTPNTNGLVSNDQFLENLLILGFEYAYNSGSNSGTARLVINRVFADCTNGLFIYSNADWSYISNCEIYPFTCVGKPTVQIRTGSAFYCNNGNGVKFNTCNEFGYAIGFNLIASSTVGLINCSCDAQGGGYPSNNNIGISISGNYLDQNIENCTIVAQGNSSILLNPSPISNTSKIFINGCKLNGTATNGLLYIQSGNYSIHQCTFANNPTYGQINLTSGAGSGDVIGCNFTQSANNSIVGNSSAIQRATFIGNTFQGVANSLYEGNQYFAGTYNNGVQNSSQGPKIYLDGQSNPVNNYYTANSTGDGLDINYYQSTGTVSSPTTAVNGNGMVIARTSAYNGSSYVPYTAIRSAITNVSGTAITGQLIISVNAGSTSLSDVYVINTDYFSPLGNKLRSCGNSSNGWNGINVAYGSTAGQTVSWTSGTVTPENNVTANAGSLYTYVNTATTAGTLYVKATGNGATGWIAK
jgi:hypothetical protein